MMRPGALLAVSLLLLSGCGGKGNQEPATGGRIEGRVLDDSQLPIEGARVRILLTSFVNSTDEAGRFAFDGVPAGLARVVASAPGFASQTRSATLTDGGRLQFDFQLAHVPVPAPRHDTLPFSGTVQCGLPGGVQCAGATADPSTTHTFEVGPDAAGLVLELVWTTPTTAFPAQLSLTLTAATDEACASPYAATSGPSVLRLAPSEGFPLSGAPQCAVVGPAEGTPTVQQAYDLSVTIFYREPAPEGFSVVP